MEGIVLEVWLIKGDYVATLGRDLDLVVQGLIFPPRITHNVFVILPADGNNKSLAGGGGGRGVRHQPLG